MEQIRAARFGAALIAALAVLISACTSPAGAGVPGAPVASVADDTAATDLSPAATIAAPEDSTGIEAPVGFDLPDITARPIGVDDLNAMLPTGDTGPAATDARAVEARANEDLVTAAVMDRSDEVNDIARYSRITGVAASYPSDTGTAYVWIDVFETSDGAAGWVTDTAGDIAKHTGGSHQASIDVASAVEYPIGVGQGSIGLILDLDNGARTETIAMFHLGRIAVFASIVRSDDSDTRVPVQYLAEEVAAGVLAVLTGTSPAAPASGDPSSYEFTFERVVEIGGTTWKATSAGTVDGTSVSCRVSLDLPSLRATRDLVSVDGRLWTRTGSGDYLPHSTAGAVDSLMLSMCPGWPVDVSRAGLAGALTGTPAGHNIGGIPALGYRGTGADLERAFGVDPAVATIAVFNLWVATDTSWVIEMDLTLTGDTTGLVQLIGPGFPEGESATVTISQRISSIGEAGRVIPPG